ncbi:MAG: SPASM domain-containing protein [Candidatus Nealsonbacteria bacterium]|nr:SPASM domain-containing protein [Candidatus Nealsonbacteria bacterium]
MELKSLGSKIKRVVFLLKLKGIGYTWNYIHFSLLFATKNSFFLKLLYWLEPYPSYLEVEVTTRCNLKCIICERTYWQEANRDMSFEEFKGIVDQFKLKWIGLTGIGESFLNKDFLRMLRYVKEKNVFVELYDNFFLVDKKTAQELIAMGIDRFFISLDAATKKTYEAIRVGSNFERVIANLQDFFALKREMKAHFPEIAFHYIVNRLNLSEIPQYIELVHSLTGGRNTTVQFTRMLHSFKETEDLFVEIPEKTVLETEKKAKELNLRVVWSADAPKTKPEIKKCAEWTMPFIFANGDVIPCCAGNEAGNRDFQKKTALGNVFRQSFKEIWRGEKYKNLRKMLREGKAPAACYNCPLYQTNH